MEEKGENNWLQTHTNIIPVRCAMMDDNGLSCTKKEKGGGKNKKKQLPLSVSSAVDYLYTFHLVKFIRTHFPSLALHVIWPSVSPPLSLWSCPKWTWIWSQTGKLGTRQLLLSFVPLAVAIINSSRLPLGRLYAMWPILCQLWMRIPFRHFRFPPKNATNFSPAKGFQRRRGGKMVRVKESEK